MHPQEREWSHTLLCALSSVIKMIKIEYEFEKCRTKTQKERLNFVK